jgi:hypothetical protein
LGEFSLPFNNVCEFLDGSNWAKWAQQVEFAYNACRAVGIDHTPFEANYGISHEEPPSLLLPMRASILVSTNAHNRLQHLREIHELVMSVLRVHKDGMQARSWSSTTPHFEPCDNVSLITKGVSLCGLKDRQLGLFDMLEKICASS